MRLAPGARRWALPPAIATLPAAVLYPPAAAVTVALTAFVLAFFRDPDRDPAGEGVLAPADGRVSVVREEDGRLRVGVFMNVWNVHVNRAPIGGRLRDREHIPGGHRPAFSKESDRNERVRFLFEAPATGRGSGAAGDRDDPEGEDAVADADRPHEVTLIAGAFARRITPYPDPGATVERGDRIGHIAFGSRADVVLPPAYDRPDLAVEEGDTVRAGETVIARPEPAAAER